jgi:hypothetical protein
MIEVHPWPIWSTAPVGAETLVNLLKKKSINVCAERGVAYDDSYCDQFWGLYLIGNNSGFWAHLGQ